MNREATEVVALFPKLDGSGHTESYWAKGTQRQNPAKHSDFVEKIMVIEESNMPRVEITYRDYGEEHIMSHITFIHYENADYREIVLSRKADKEDKDASGLSKRVIKNTRQKYR